MDIETREVYFRAEWEIQEPYDLWSFVFFDLLQEEWLKTESTVSALLLQSNIALKDKLSSSLFDFNSVLYPLSNKI